jgi:RND family efflux transporter MFP subunit
VIRLKRSVEKWSRAEPALSRVPGNPNSHGTRYVPPALPAILLLVFAAGCAETPPIAEPPPPKVTVQHPEERELVDYDRYNGWMQASDTVEVRSRVRGHIRAVHFTDGQSVNKGDLLFELDPRPFEAEIGRASDQLAVDQAQLEYAVAELDRQEQLYQKKAATKSDVEKYRAARNSWDAKVKASEQEITRRKLDLEYSRVAAEASGRIGRAMLTAGNLVNAGGSDPLLTTIVTVDPIQIYFAVDERSLLKYRQRRGSEEYQQEYEVVTADNTADPAVNGTVVPASGSDEEAAPRKNVVRDLKIPVEFGLETEEGYPHQGVIDFADNRIDPETGTIEVRGTAPNSEGTFVPGARVRVQVPISEPYRAIVVPDAAILSDQDQRYVLVLNDENVVVRRGVTLGRLLPDGMRVILPATEQHEGLSPADWVIVLGLQRARVNYPVEPVDADGKPIARDQK